jgi:hypothetical protein
MNFNSKLTNEQDRQPTKEEIEEYFKEKAQVVAFMVRRNIEDFHAKHLSDDQMAELNPLIRDAIYTALITFFEFEGGTEPDESYERAKQEIEFCMKMIPSYWEEPKLITG